MRNKGFESTLPNGYVQALHIDARSKKFGIILNVIALAIMLTVIAIALVTLIATGRENIFSASIPEALISSTLFLICYLAYVVLHELVHGAAYKLLTGQKLTFGLSWSCAFCGVPNIYVSRRTALAAVTAPLIAFTIILAPICAVLYYVHPLYYLFAAIIFGGHIGGCSGDIYVTWLLLTRFKSKDALMRDTGPEQFFYLPGEDKNESK